MEVVADSFTFGKNNQASTEFKLIVQLDRARMEFVTQSSQRLLRVTRVFTSEADFLNAVGDGQRLAEGNLQRQHQNRRWRNPPVKNRFRQGMI